MFKEQNNKLKDRVSKIIKEISYNNNIKQDIGREFISRNLQAYRAVTIFTNPDYLNILTDSDDDIRFLYIFSLALSKALKKNNIDMELNYQNYFTELENNTWKEYREESKENNVFPIVFENALQISDRIWQTTLTAHELDRLSTANIILYNFKTQRSPKITISGVSIDYDKQKTIEIKNRLLSGEQFPDHIKLNILNNFQEKIYYDPKTKTLTIKKKYEIFTSNLFTSRMRRIKIWLGLPFLSMTSVFMSGMIHDALEIYKKKGEVTKYDYIKICVKFNYGLNNNFESQYWFLVKELFEKYLELKIRKSG